MKCAFCGGELQNANGTLVCTNWDCKNAHFGMPEIVAQALLDGCDGLTAIDQAIVLLLSARKALVADVKGINNARVYEYVEKALIALAQGRKGE